MIKEQDLPNRTGQIWIIYEDDVLLIVDTHVTRDFTISTHVVVILNKDKPGLEQIHMNEYLDTRWDSYEPRILERIV